MVEGNGSVHDRFIPIDDIPDSSLLPDGAYEVRVGMMEEKHSEKTGILGYKVWLRVVGGVYDNMPMWDTFWIGTEDDPDAQEGNTWKRFGAVRFKSFLKSTGAQLSSSFQSLAASVQSQHCMAVVVTKEDKEYGPQNKVQRYVPVGDIEAGEITKGSASTQRTQSAQTAPRGITRAQPGAGGYD